MSTIQQDPVDHNTTTLAPPAEPPPKPPRFGQATTRQVVIFAVALAVVAVASLILLLTITGRDVDADEADVTVLSQHDVTDALLRSAPGPGEVELEALYTPTWYFDWSGRPEPATDGSPTLAFFLFETTHTVNLPDDVPTIAVVTPAGSFGPYEVTRVTESPHHRTSQVLFPAETTSGEPILDENETLVLEATWPDGYRTSLEWSQPLPFGLGALNTVGTDTTFRMPALSLGAIAAIFGGMLAALTPCMLLLAAFYTAVLSGTAAAADKRYAERRLLTTGLFFVGGFTLIYTAGGVIAGYIGESLTRFENIGGYARPVSIVAGVAVIILGIRMASQSRVPMVCKLPGFNRPTQSGWVGSALMGATFAVGCLSCFSATVLTALLLYAGATGSPIAGGLVMLMFSAGIGVMFLIAAILVARAAPVSEWLHKAQPIIGGVAAAIMIFLGILMVTYKFHLLTGWLFEAWS